MKKSAFKKPDEAMKQRQKLSRPTLTQSDSNLLTVPPRKASTPTHDRTAATASPDISCIVDDTKDEVSEATTSAGKPAPVKKLLKKQVASKKADLQKTLDIEYTKYLQSVLRNKLLEKKASDIDNDLVNIKKRIEKNQELLQKTTKRLQNINFNKEIAALHELNNPNYGKALETVNSSNCDEYLSTLHEKLEQRSNQLKLVDIEMPEGGAAELMGVISDTMEVFEKAKVDNNRETWELSADALETNKTLFTANARNWESLPEIEQLLLTRSTLKSCTPS